MTVRDIIILAQTGELLQLSPAIKDNDDTVVAFINLGLVEIYKRFILRTSEAVLTLKDGKTTYKLDGTDVDTVIVDGVETDCVVMGTGDYMYMTAAYGPGFNELDRSVTDVLLPINVEDDPLSVNTVSYDEVQAPDIVEDTQMLEGTNIRIVYTALPDRVDTTVVGWDTLQVAVPDQFIEALLHYVGYRGHGSMDGSIEAENNTHYMRFEASCNRMLTLGVGITPDDVNMGNRILDRGFA